MHYLLLRNSGYFLFLSIILVLFNVDLNAQSGKSKDFSVSYSDKGDKDVKGYDPLGVSDWQASKVNDNSYSSAKPKVKKVLPYEYLREEDILYRVKVWREIPVKEKINMSFRYNTEGDNGDQRFIMLVLKALKERKITAYASENDRFTDTLNYKELTESIVGKPEVIRVVDWSDPTGNTKKDTTIINEFDPNSVEFYRVKEEWIFDKARSQMICRTIGIAPLKTIYNADGSFRDRAVLFWLYYPNCRNYFSTLEVYNPANLSYRQSWEELWEQRMYSSYIVKSNLDNPFNMNISGYIKNPILRLLESDKIKNSIFDYEQNLWSY